MSTMLTKYISKLTKLFPPQDLGMPSDRYYWINKAFPHYCPYKLMLRKKISNWGAHSIVKSHEGGSHSVGHQNFIPEGPQNIDLFCIWRAVSGCRDKTTGF